MLAAAPLSAKAPGLTVKAGETWQFSLFRGQPVKAHKASLKAKPGPGQIR